MGLASYLPMTEIAKKEEKEQEEIAKKTENEMRKEESKEEKANIEDNKNKF